MLNFGNTNRKIREDNGRGARTFTLSMIFIFLIIISFGLTLAIFLVDLDCFNKMKKFIGVERAIKNEVIALKSSSLTLAVGNFF